jgi:DNA-binding MarR family transcriptional regulator
VTDPRPRRSRPQGPATPWLLRRVNQRYRRAVAARLADARLGGLPRPGYWLLMALASGATDASQLVGAMGVTKQAVSKVVDALVSGGFVRRRPNATDLRPPAAPTWCSRPRASGPWR